MADPLTFALTEPELAQALVRVQRERVGDPQGDAHYQALIARVPLALRADAHEFAILTRLPVIWTQSDRLGEPAGEVLMPGFVRCWLEGAGGWRILGAAGPVRGIAEGRQQLEVRLDVAPPQAAHGFPVIVVVDGPFSLTSVARDSAEYLARHGLLQEEVPRTYLLALLMYLGPQLEQLIGWFRDPARHLRFGAPQTLSAFERVGLRVLDYPVHPLGESDHE